MPRIPSRPYPPRLARVIREEDGFGLIEVMVSAVMVVVVAVATLNLIDRTNAATASNRSRVVASNLAHAALNQMRSQSFAVLQGYDQTTPVKQGGITYSVKSQATWTTDTNATLNCNSSGSYSPYLKITSTVTWPNMGQVAPVTASSFVTPRASDVATGAGSLVAIVKDAHAQPVQGASVSVQGKTLTTDAEGCVIYHFLTAGSTKVTWWKTGTIAPSGQAVGSMDVSITNNTIATITPLLDVPASIHTTIVRDDGKTPPTTAAWISGQATTGGTFFQTAYAQATNTGSGTSLKSNTGSSFTHPSVFPTIAGYGVYTGNCPGNDPTLYVQDFQTTHPRAFATPDPGGSADALAYVKPVTLRISRSSSSNNKYDIHFSPYLGSDLKQMTGCTTTVTLADTLPSNVNTLQNVTVDMPYGLYTVCVDNEINAGNTSARAYKNSTTLAVLPDGTSRGDLPSDNTNGSLTFPLSSGTQRAACA
jgi:Tfp pilus assembly protein PilV